MQSTSFDEFQQQAMHGNVIPVTKRLMADMVTPVAAFKKLRQLSVDGFLFESIEGGAKLARYSFLGCNPREKIEYNGNNITITRGETVEKLKGNIFEFLQTERRKWQYVRSEELPRFCGGFVGYFGYDCIRDIEQVPSRHDDQTKPYVRLGNYDTILAFDHVRQQILIIANAHLTSGCDLRQEFDAASDRIRYIESALRAPLPDVNGAYSAHAAVEANFDENAFCDAVDKAKSYIYEGDIFQVVLSQRFSRKLTTTPLDVYRALRVINPSPYMYYFEQHGHTTVGASPELLVRVEDGEIVVRPIAGTRPRGKTELEDARLAADLLADEKELAEHAMLVDLGRNDVGRVAAYDSVHLSERMIVEKYSHVMHIVSEVRGKLKSRLDGLDAFQACFPAGTVSGAPKIRAMEIIDELEPQSRGLYSGAMGYLDYSGNLDTCITIRTMEIEDGMAHFQAGAGIVADSVPTKEYHETIHKSNAIRAAIAMAEGGLK